MFRIELFVETLFAMLNSGEATQLAFSLMMEKMHIIILSNDGIMISNHKLWKKSKKKGWDNMILTMNLVAQLKACMI